MTNAIFNFKNNKVDSFKIKGHALSNTYGNDIVCAAISSTSIMALNGIVELSGIKNINYTVKEGYINCNLEYLSDDEYAKIEILISSLISFFKDLQKEYPKNFNIVVKEV